MDIRKMSREDLEREFETRKAALIEVRDEIDRRERGTGREAKVEWTKYVENSEVD